MPLSQDDSALVRKIVHRDASVVLDETKDYLLESRLSRLAIEMELSSPEEIMKGVRSGDKEMTRQLVESMTTPETSFFRDHHPFKVLKEVVLPKMIKERMLQKKLTIWSGACAHGQEAYSIGMIIREHFPQIRNWDVKILATDLAKKTLARAEAAEYLQIEVNRGLPAAMIPKYFERDGTVWRVKDTVRNLVEFRQLNLTSSWHLGCKPDIVFLRNVLIYFDNTSKEKVFRSLRLAMPSDGLLFLGGAETTMANDTYWEQVAEGRARYYRLANRKSTAASAAAGATI